MDELGPIYPNSSDKEGRVGLAGSLAALTATQHALISTQQLRAAGFTQRRIHDWLAAGRLRHVCRGVYSTSHAPLTREARWMAAVLACGSGAILSHLSAAAALGMRKTDPPVVDVTAPRGRKHRAGIRLHRPSLLPLPEEQREISHVPLTSPARTFLDCAAVLGDWSLTQMLSAAEREDYFAPDELAARLPATGRGRAGLANARRVLARYASAPGLIRTGLEQRLWQVCVEHGPPLPETNVFVAGYEVDFLWRELMLIVETDGGPWHSTVVDRDKDARRDAVHRALGYEVVRITDAEMEAPERVATWLAETLGRLLAGVVV
jgi:very-short-patch-repair endonuclease